MTTYTTTEDARTALENSGVNEWITDDTERAAVIERMFRHDLTPEQAVESPPASLTTDTFDDTVVVRDPTGR